MNTQRLGWTIGSAKRRSYADYRYSVLIACELQMDLWRWLEFLGRR